MLVFCYHHVCNLIWEKSFLTFGKRSATYQYNKRFTREKLWEAEVARRGQKSFKTNFHYWDIWKSFLECIQKYSEHLTLQTTCFFHISPPFDYYLYYLGHCWKSSINYPLTFLENNFIVQNKLLEYNAMKNFWTKLL